MSDRFISCEERIEAAHQIACEVTAGTLLATVVWLGVVCFLVRWVWSWV